MHTESYQTLQESSPLVTVRQDSPRVGAACSILSSSLNLHKEKNLVMQVLIFGLRTDRIRVGVQMANHQSLFPQRKQHRNCFS
jgi:hypothetical protein